MLTLVEASKRVQWDTFNIQDEFKAKFLINVGIAIISSDMLKIMLSEQKWSGVRYLTDSGYKIGYGIGDPGSVQGHTEAESYAEWIGNIRNKQKIVRAQLPVVGITQTAYDALVSLYIDTGTWRTVQADEGTYDVASAVKAGNWLLVADMISRGKINPQLRKKEAHVAQLASYNISRDRNQQIIEGIQTLRKSYIAGITNEFDKKQTEFAYYRQLNVFLPGMSQLRQRRVAAQALT